MIQGNHDVWLAREIMERVLITNGIERAEYASRTPAVEAILFRDHIKSY